MGAREPGDLTDDDGEVVDALPVGADEGPRPHVTASTPVAAVPPTAPMAAPGTTAARTVPVAQAAAVAAGSFAAGAVTIAVVRGVGRRRAVKSSKRRRSGLPIAGTRSFLVDVHLLGSKD